MSLDRLSSKRVNRAERQRALRITPMIDGLESRALMAVSVNLSPAGELRIDGDRTNDRVVLAENASTISVLDQGSAARVFNFPKSKVKSILFYGEGSGGIAA